jgi:lambda family phage portal protein
MTATRIKAAWAAFRGIRPMIRRAYLSAQTSRLFADWFAGNQSGMEEVRAGLRTCRERSRDMERNDDYWLCWLQTVCRNVVGHRGIQVQVKALDRAGQADTTANAELEAAWAQWGKVGTCTADARLSWIDVQRLVVRCLARDGEALVRLVRGYPNQFGFAVQPVESDLLDDQYNQLGGTGRPTIRMGVEVDEWDRPVAYWLRTTHPGDQLVATKAKQYERVPAADMLHIYREDRIGQTRGLPWGQSAMRRLKMLGGYDEAELVAARAAASKMGVWEAADGTFTGDEEQTDGSQLLDFQPGSFHVAPPGKKLHLIDPTHPNGRYSDFVKACLRGISAGLDISYNRLAKDLEGVTYSSLRSGELDERDAYMAMQTMVVEHLVQPVWSAWLSAYLLSPLTRLPAADYDRLNQPRFLPRRWTWVDPMTDVRAAEVAVRNRWKTNSQIAAELGCDYDENVAELGTEAEAAEAAGLTPQPEATGRP